MGRTPLRKVADNILRALECPEEGFVFDDFDARYRKKEHKREADSADWFYHNKASFESIYETTLGDGGDEPAWVTDGGRGRDELFREISYAADGDEFSQDKEKPRKEKKPRKNNKRTITDRRWYAALRRVYRRAANCATTLKLIRKNGSNREASIWELAKEENAQPEKEKSHRK